MSNLELCMSTAKISSCNKTPNRQVTKGILDSHTSRESEFRTCSGSESCTNLSSEIGITSPDVAHCVVTDPVTPTNKTFSGETSAKETPRGGTTTSKASSSSDHSSNASIERISKYLIQYVPETPKRKKGNLRRVMGQRVLTSTEGLALLQEKEAKKQKKTQEVEQRKRERETKRKEKEEEAKRKAREKQKKTTARKRSATCTRAVSKKSKSTEQSSDINQPSTSENQAVIPEESDQAEMRDEEDEDATCCECNVSYEDDVRCSRGEEWVRCACDRWIHSKCIDEVIIDADGNERICSFCVI